MSLVYTPYGVYQGPFVAIRPTVCAVAALFLYTLNDLVVLYFT